MRWKGILGSNNSHGTITDAGRTEVTESNMLMGSETQLLVSADMFDTIEEEMIQYHQRLTRLCPQSTLVATPLPWQDRSTHLQQSILCANIITSIVIAAQPKSKSM